MATGGKASVDAASDMLGDGSVENDSESPVSGKDGSGEEMVDKLGEVTGVEDGPEEANMK
jgi:hypothetical protein